jgi:hypothetical protein
LSDCLRLHAASISGIKTFYDWTTKTDLHSN